MFKRVRRRPKHNTAMRARKGVIYLNPNFIGTDVVVLTTGQYKYLLKQLKLAKLKLRQIKGLLIYEYSRT